MPLRLSGLISGMDTESIIQELMKAQRLKSTKIENNITKLEWTQDKWKSLNTKMYSFYTGSISKLRMQGNYSTKKASSSNEDKVEIKASITAPEGTHSIKVKEMASSQFVTGAKLGTDINGKAITTGTKLTDMGFNASEGTTVTVKTANKEVSLDIGSSTTIGDFTSALKDAGINAVYDTNQKRFFVSSKESGTEGAFSITTSSSEYTQDRNAIRDYIGYDTLSSSEKDTVDGALSVYIDPVSVQEDKDVARDSLLTVTHSQVQKDYIHTYVTDQTNIDTTTTEVRAELEADLAEGETLDEDVLKAAVNERLITDAEEAVTIEYEAWKAGTAPDTNVFKLSETQLDGLLADYATDSGTIITQTNDLSLLGLSEITTTTNADGSVSVSGGTNVTLVNPSDATVIYNGAELTSSSNTITANGLTFTLKGVTAGMDTPDTSDDEVISLSVSNDTQAVYDMIKGFVKTYNELLKEMNESYNAPSARGYEPLTDEEKDTMSETQVDQWEDKIKTSLLRRDSTLSTLTSTMRSTLSESVTVDGKTYSLASFGIGSVNYTEKGMLHIDGDEDDTLVSSKENDLMNALNDNPDLVMKVFSKLTGELYETMTDKMSSTSLRSALTFYNDKEIAKEITSYKSDLSKLEDKLQDMEDRYYKQFAAMETAMAKLNSQSSSLASMMGTGQQ